jgi:hypothetical protein
MFALVLPLSGIFTRSTWSDPVPKKRNEDPVGAGCVVVVAGAEVPGPVVPGVDVSVPGVVACVVVAPPVPGTVTLPVVVGSLGGDRVVPFRLGSEPGATHAPSTAVMEVAARRTALRPARAGATPRRSCVFMVLPPSRSCP